MLDAPGSPINRCAERIEHHILAEGIMGRYISCKVGDEYETVWKYELGVQSSEIYRISSELGIGEYHMIRYREPDKGDNGENAAGYDYITDAPFSEEIAIDDWEDIDGDILILKKTDVIALDQHLQRLQQLPEAHAHHYFLGMIVAIRNFMVNHSDQDQFIFEGEF
jgi:hypothetical protein